MLIYTLGTISLVYFFKNKIAPDYFKNWLGSYWYISLVFICIILFVVFMYPIADGLKSQMRGSDQDDCVIISVKQLLQMSHPYTQRSYYGAPCSSGLGMLLIYLPFVALNIYEMGAIFFGFFATLTIRNYLNNTYELATFITLFFSSIFVIELLTVGSDLFIIGFGLVILGYNLVRGVNNKNKFSIFWLAILTGLLASTRINFIIIVPIVSILIFIHWPKGGLIFAFISTCIAVIPSLFVYLINPLDFTPLHLTGKADFLLKNGLKEIGIFTSIFTLFFGIYLVKKNVEYIPIALYLSLLPHLLAVSIGDIINFREGNFAEWEGANYLLPILPLSVVFLIKRLYYSEQR